VQRALLGCGLYAAVLGLFGAALGLLLRSTAGAVTLGLSLIFVFGNLVMLVPGSFGDWLTKLMPGNAGSSIATVQSFNPELLDPWTGFAVFCAERRCCSGSPPCSSSVATPERLDSVYAMAAARYKDLCIDANDAGRMGRFWAAVLGSTCTSVTMGWYGSVGRRPSTPCGSTPFPSPSRSSSAYTSTSTPPRWTTWSPPEPCLDASRSRGRWRRTPRAGACVFVREPPVAAALRDRVDTALTSPRRHPQPGGVAARRERRARRAWVPTSTRFPGAVRLAGLRPVPEPQDGPRTASTSTSTPTTCRRWLAAGGDPIRPPREEIGWTVLADRTATSSARSPTDRRRAPRPPSPCGSENASHDSLDLSADVVALTAALSTSSRSAATSEAIADAVEPPAARPPGGGARRHPLVAAPRWAAPSGCDRRALDTVPLNANFPRLEVATCSHGSAPANEGWCRRRPPARGDAERAQP
jgi:hypothetical protein